MTMTREGCGDGYSVWSESDTVLAYLELWLWPEAARELATLVASSEHGDWSGKPDFVGPEQHEALRAALGRVGLELTVEADGRLYVRAAQAVPERVDADMEVTRREVHVPMRLLVAGVR